MEQYQGKNESERPAEWQKIWKKAKRTNNINSRKMIQKLREIESNK